MNKQQLHQQINDMKVKLAEMEAELSKSNEFEWNYPNGTTFSIYFDHIKPDSAGTVETHTLVGTYRIHKHNAESALQLTKETKLIGAIAEQLFPDDAWTADWNNDSQLKYFIIEHNCSKLQYTVDYYSTLRTPGVHYMSKQIAEAVCDVLNSGKVVL